jgi:hypothetical protein
MTLEDWSRDQDDVTSCLAVNFWDYQASQHSRCITSFNIEQSLSHGEHTSKCCTISGVWGKAVRFSSSEQDHEPDLGPTQKGQALK